MITIHIDTHNRIIRIDSDARASNDAEFERKHPRDKDGRFGTGGGSTKSSAPGSRMSIKCHATLDGSQICEYNPDTMSRKQYISDAQKWYERNYKGRTAQSPIIGKVNFYMTGFRESLTNNLGNIDNLKYLPAIMPILQASMISVKEPPRHERHDDISSFERVFGNVKFNNVSHTISFLIAVDKRGNKFYCLDIPETTIQKKPKNIADNGENWVSFKNSVKASGRIVNIFLEG